MSPDTLLNLYSVRDRSSAGYVVEQDGRPCTFADLYAVLPYAVPLPARDGSYPERWRAAQACRALNGRRS